jgi:hypothetical protein
VGSDNTKIDHENMINFNAILELSYSLSLSLSLFGKGSDVGSDNIKIDHVLIFCYLPPDHFKQQKK